MYHRIAIYPSVLYGEDFIAESIESILPIVERVFVIFMRRPWGNTEGVRYKDEWISWPEVFDRARERVATMRNEQIEVVEAQKDSPWDRWGFAVNNIVRDKLQIETKEVLLLDPDCVFSKKNVLSFVTEWIEHPEYTWAQPKQVELWRTPAWQITRPRSMVSIHRGDLSLLSSDRRGTRQPPLSYQLSAMVHNLGFCVSPEAMRWKHLTAMAFSPVIGESLPNESWYEEKWLNWKPGMGDLEVSQGCENMIQSATPYDVRDLPESIQKLYTEGRW